MKFPGLLSAACLLAGTSPILAAPANDNFSAATLISATSGSLAAVNTATATVEPGEPLHAEIDGGHSVWHRFTPPAKDRFVFNTNGSSFDTTMAAYTGSAVNALTELDSDDDDGAGNNSLIEFTAGPANPVSIAIDGYQEATGNAMLAWSLSVLPNNAFASAIALTGPQGAVSGWNFRATAEASEPNAGSSVWYTWTAPATSTGLFTLNSPDMESFIGVYTGSSLGSLTQVTTVTAAAGADAQVSFSAVSGTVYRVQIKGSTGSTGEFNLSWGVGGGGTNAPMLPDIISVASQANNFMYGWNLDQNQIPGRTLLRVTTATANIGAGKLELRGSNANPAVYQRVFNFNGTWTDRLAGTFTFHPSHGHLHFDGWLQFHLRSVTPGDGVGDIIAAGDKTSFAIFDLQSHDLSLPGAPQSSVYSGGLTQGISVGWRDVYSSTLADQWIDVTNVPPGTYWLESVADPDNRVLESDETNNTARIQITYAGSAPPNNSFTASTLLTGGTAATNGRNFSATKEGGEPSHAGNAGGKSVWYRWVATATGPVTVSTAGSNFDTLLGVYTGSTVSGLTALASNDDDGAFTTSRLTFAAVSGTTYRIAVDGKGGVAGSIEIAINPGTNDHFANAFTLAGSSGNTSGSNRGATAEAGEPSHAGGPAANSIWYAWNATLTGDAAFSTEGSTFDARLAVYSGASLAALTPVASAVGAGLNVPATVNFHINSGTRYYIAVDGGPGVLHLRWESATAIAPYIISHPPTGNHQQGTNLRIQALIGGSPTLTYQWRFAGNVISDGTGYSGTNTSTLTVHKIDFADSGAYTLTAVNPSGTVTTNPANIIVITNPRTASITDSPGDIGGSVFAPVMFNTTGNEHGLQFTLVYDPALLSNGRITAGAAAAGAAITLDRSQESGGRLGVTLTLPGTDLFAAGLQHALDAQFDVSPEVAPGVTMLAFDGSPVLHHALSATGAALPAVFDPANITLNAVQPAITSEPAPGGGATIAVRGLRGKAYQLLQSADMNSWTVAQTQPVGSSGIVVFTVPAPAGGRSFYMAAPAP
jgi:hypothetical protein